MMLFSRFYRLFSCILLPTIGIIAFTSCNTDSEKQIKEVANNFSSAYFNWRFSDASKYVLNDSRRWLVYASSQVNQQDVDSLRAMKEGATLTIDNISYENNGSIAKVKVIVSNYLLMDSIGIAPRVCQHGEYEIPLSYDGKEWTVSLSAPLRGTNIK